jgi:hypothetical protein
MGFNVSGKEPSSEAGEYFRNNVWWWHPLWDYCCSVAPDICDKVEYAHSNDGDGLGKRDSTRLAKVLKAEVSSGRTRVYQELREADLNSMPDEPCQICAGTGKRSEPPESGAGDIPCNGCAAKGTVRPWATHYPFSVENVQRFILFLEGCGGFTIY